jgi:hypothetical protein
MRTDHLGLTPLMSTINLALAPPNFAELAYHERQYYGSISRIFSSQSSLYYYGLFDAMTYPDNPEMIQGHSYPAVVCNRRDAGGKVPTIPGHSD